MIISSLLPKTLYGFKFYVLFLIAILSLGLIWVFMLVPDKTDDVTDIDKIAYRICHNDNVDPSSMEKMRLFLFRTEEVRFENDLDLQEYLCGNCRNCEFPFDDKQFKAIFGMTKKFFHQTIKTDLLGYLMKNSRFRKYLKKIDTNNPNFGYNKNTGRIVLQNPKNLRETLETNVLRKDILP